ncbi:MAG: hypothetical protein KTR31_22580 [Myxococcales bacterium]|nr:hypothetical protein [Myxococcales bacterium]
MRTINAWMLAVLVGGCSGEPVPDPVEPPPEVANATLFIMEHFDDEDTSDLAFALSEELLPFLQEKWAKVDGGDPDADPEASPFAEIPAIDAASLGTLSFPTWPEGYSEDDQKFPLAYIRRSAQGMAENRTLAMEVNRVCIESETTLYARREFTEGGDCFGDGSCDDLRVFQPTYKKNPLTEIWYDEFFRYRVIDIDVGGETRQAMIQRGWIEEPFYAPNGNNVWLMLYSLDVVIEDGDGSFGWNAYWSALDVNLLSDGLLSNSIQEGLRDASNWAETWMATGAADKGCPNDRAEEEPERWENVGN